MPGLTIKLFLVDGSPTGMMTAEIGNWVGKALVVPRAQLAELASRPEAGRTGIYCLVGRDPENPTREVVYIGETDSLIQRLAYHDRDVKQQLDFWTRTILVSSKDENLTKAHVRYLESRLIAMSRAAGRARMVNGQSPEPTPLPESDREDMEQFLRHLEVLLPALGFAFLQPAPQVAAPSLGAHGHQPLFLLRSKGVDAKAREIDGEFVVLKGSTACRDDVPSSTARERRAALIADGKMVPHAQNPEWLVFAADVPFDSPSAAAGAVKGASTNGRLEWKESATGKSYGDWKDVELQKAGMKAEPAS